MVSKARKATATWHRRARLSGYLSGCLVQRLRDLNGLDFESTVGTLYLKGI
jgi:hypothetical protein